MKLENKEVFTPVCITLESKEEVAEVVALLRIATEIQNGKGFSVQLMAKNLLHFLSEQLGKEEVKR